MSTAFPKFHSHDKARCFNCAACGMTNARPSDYAQGRGAYVADCPACQMSTWYDLRAPRVARDLAVIDAAMSRLIGA